MDSDSFVLEFLLCCPSIQKLIFCEISRLCSHFTLYYTAVDNLPRVVRRKSRRSRPATSYGFPEISITNQSDTKTMRRKYHTLKSLVYTEPVENIKEMRRRPRSAGSTIRNKEAMSRPSILETLDFINGVKDALCGKSTISTFSNKSLIIV